MSLAHARAGARLPTLDPTARRLTALFRARARPLRRSLDPKTALAVELLPALFHANFPWPQLKTDPPGVEGARVSLRWTRLAREFDLPAPTGVQRGRRLVAALVVTPAPGLLDVHVVPAANLSPYEEQRLAQRARAVETLLTRRALAVRIAPTGPSAQPCDAASRTRLLSFGALVAGRLPGGFFEAGAPTTDALAAQLWLTAPTELARALSLLTLEPWAAGEMAELREVADLARAVGRPLWCFANPALLMAARAALRSRRPRLAFSACALAEPSPSARRTAQALATHFGAPAADAGLLPSRGADPGAPLAARGARPSFDVPRSAGDPPVRLGAGPTPPFGAGAPAWFGNSPPPSSASPPASFGSALSDSFGSSSSWLDGGLPPSFPPVSRGSSAAGRARPGSAGSREPGAGSPLARPHASPPPSPPFASSPSLLFWAGASAHDGAPPAEDVLRVCRALAVELSQAVRSLPRSPEAAALRARLPHELLGGGCPRVLLPALKAALRRSARGELPAMVEAWVGRAVEVRLASGGVLGRGANPAQAWVRALSLLGHAWGQGVVPPGLAPAWRKLAPKLLPAPRHQTLWLEVEAQARPAQPADPLNRGPGRELGLTSALAVALRPRGRPSARTLSPEQTTPLVLEETLRGTALGFIPGAVAAQPVEARLLRVARRCRGLTPWRPLAVEVGGAVFVVGPQGLTRRAGPPFARRPERCAFDAEAPDFGVQVTDGREVRVGPNQVECLVWSDDGVSARLLTADVHGHVLREQIPLERVEESLAEAQRLLRPEPMSALSVRVADSVSSRALRRREALAPAVRLTVRGELPFRVELELDGERFGAGNRWGWRAAASAVLAHWPAGVLGELEFQAIDVSLDGQRTGGLWRLYVRSAVRRRLLAHIEALARTFSARRPVPNR